MMQEIANGTINLASFITAIITITTAISVVLQILLKPIKKQIGQIDTNQCRNYLVDFLVDVYNGETKDEDQIARAYELYDHYIKDLGLNSYVHAKWERVMVDGERKGSDKNVR